MTVIVLLVQYLLSIYYLHNTPVEERNILLRDSGE